jgi:hypothetical protein
MSDNTLFAIIFCGFFVFASVAVASSTMSGETNHEKVMNKIEEQKALLELKNEVEYRRLVKWADSMSVEINKR